MVDDDPTIVSLARVGSGAVTEGGKVEFTVTLGRALVAGEIIDVPLSIGGTGVTTGDWSLAEKSGATNTGVTLSDTGTSTPKVRFSGANAETATLELTATADGTAESGGSETFTIALGSNSDFDAVALGTNVGGGADPHATALMNSFSVTVNDAGTAAAATLSISAPSTSANEGNSGMQTLTYTVTASAAPSAFTHWRVCFSGTAMRDEGGTSDPFATNADYRALDSGNALETSACTGTFQFGPSLTTTTTNISIQVIGDTDIEPDETVVATLSFIGMPPAGVTLGTSVHTYTITNDDTATAATHTVALKVFSNETRVVEGEKVPVVVELSHKRSAATDVILAPRHIDTGSNDFPAANGGKLTVTIPAGHRVGYGDFPTFENTATEPDEKFQIFIDSADVTVDESKVMNVTIINDDDASNRLIVKSSTPTPFSYDEALALVEGGGGGFSVRLTGPPSGNVTVTISEESDSGNKIEFAGGAQQTTLTFTRNKSQNPMKETIWHEPQTVSVWARQDDDTEGLNRYLTLTPSGGGYPPIPVRFRVSVNDDDDGQNSPTDPEGQVPDTAVSNVQASAIDAVSAKVTWDEVEHATSYEVDWDGESADQQYQNTGVVPGITGATATIQHYASEALTLTITVTPEYVDGNGQVQRLTALAGTTTLEVGPAGTQGTDDDSPLVDPYATLIAQMYEWRNDPQWASHRSHTDRWDRALLAFGESVSDSSLTPMTAAEAQAFADRGMTRWVEVAKALHEIESGGTATPDPVPEVTVSGGAGVTEGDPASFTVTANPAPPAPLTVTLTVGQSGDVAAAGATGSREVTVPTGGSVTLDIATVDDGTDEPDGSITATLAAGDGYTVAASPDDAASVAVADDDTAANAYAALIAKMYTWRNDPQWASHRSHTDRWDRALLAFGESVSDSTLTPMTAAEAQAFADRGMTRWVEVAAALHEIESGGTATPDPVPVVTVSGGAGVTEGDPASFTVTANPAPSAPLTVKLTVGQSGDVAAAGATGSREIEIPVAGSVTLDIATVDDAADEPDGSVSVTVDAGNGYTVGSANAHTVSVADDDTGPAAVPELSLAAGSAVDEGGNAEFTIAANPAPQAALTVAFTIAQSGDYLSAPDPASRTVTLAAGVTSTTLTLATVEDEADEADGSVSVTIDAGDGYTVAAGQDTGTVAVADNDEPVVSIAAGAGVTEGDPASFTVTASPTPAAPLTVTLTVGQSGDFAASGETGSREVTVPTGGSVTVEVATDDDSADEPDGSISATLAAGSGYTVAASPDDTASVAVTDNDEAAGVPSLSVADGEANENEGRLPVVLRLSPPSKGTVSVWAKTRESNPVSARAGVDYRVWSRWGTRIVFRPGETEKRLAVRLLNDSHDEDAETFEVVLTDPTGGAAIADGVGTMTIVNSDPMPAAWLARFGRTVAEQALDGIAGRMAAPRTAGAQGTIAGQALSFGDPDGSAGAANDNAALGSVGLTDSGSLAQSDIARAFGTSGNGGLGHDAFGPGSGPGQAFGTGGIQPRSQGMTGLEALLGSSFTATGEKDGAGGSMAFWGRAAQSRFDGREGTFSLDGETTSAMLGADYARGKWLVGLALMQSSGEGGYADSGTGQCPDMAGMDEAMRAYLCDGAVREGDGKVEASLTAAVPYAAIQASERLKLWGAAGYGTGEVTLKPEPGGALKSDISWTMASAGLRGELLPPPKEGSGPALAVTSDALWARTSSEKTSELAASDSDVTRLRVGLEGSWRIATEGGGSLTPKLEVGARHDGGDAETGFGVEVGGGLAWMDPRLGLSLDLSGRTLVAHGSDDLEDRGFAASLAFDPNPASARGPSLTLRQDWGGQAKGGLDALFRTDPLADRTGGGEATSRWQAEAAWGFPAFSGRFTGSPHVGLGLATAARDYSLGWRLTPAANANAPDISFGVKATRRESNTAAPEHTVGFEAVARW